MYLPPEVLCIAFDLTDRPTLVACATVNRSWSQVALDFIWREMPSVLPIIELLGRMEYDKAVGGWVSGPSVLVQT